MAEPPDQVPAAAGRGHLRASHADREHVIEVFKAAFVQGRLTKAELDARAGQALVARTYADLAALTADVPRWAGGRRAAAAGCPGAGPATGEQCSQGGHMRGHRSSRAGHRIDPHRRCRTFVFAPFYFMALLVAGAQVLASRHDKRSRGQLPPRPAQRGRAVGADAPGLHRPEHLTVALNQALTDL